MEKSTLDYWVKPLWENLHYHEIVQYISLSIYLIICFRFLNEVKLGADFRTYRWARDLVFGMTVISFIWLFHIIIFNTPLNFISESDASDYYLLYLPIITLFFYLSIRQLLQVTPFRPNEYNSSELIEKSKLLQEIIAEKQLYRQTALKLDDLSKSTGINQKMISFVLNHYVRIGFNEYINEFRVKQALIKLENGDHKRLSLEGLAMEVGFTSRSTFYRAFKQHTGQHPSGYIKK